MKRHTIRASTVFLLTLAVALPALAGVDFRALGLLPGGYGGEPTAISGDGSVVAGWVRMGSGERVFRWTVGAGLEDIGPGQAWGLSADGSVMVGGGWKRTTGGPVASLGTLPGMNMTQARAVSADSSVVVGHSSHVTYDIEGPVISAVEAFSWTERDGMVGLGYLPGGQDGRSVASAVSADGSVIVGSSSSSAALGHSEAFRWTRTGGMVGLGDLPGQPLLWPFESEAGDVSADGSVVVGRGISASGWEAFRWTESGGMVGLGQLPRTGFSSYSWANAVSADGSVVVGESTAGAFIWTAEQGMRSVKDVLLTDYGLDLGAWWLYYATDVSSDGRTLIGLGRDPEGTVQGWIAVIPEPATLSLLALGGAGVLIRRRRRY